MFLGTFLQKKNDDATRILGVMIERRKHHIILNYRKKMHHWSIRNVRCPLGMLDAFYVWK